MYYGGWGRRGMSDRQTHAHTHACIMILCCLCGEFSSWLSAKLLRCSSYLHVSQTYQKDVICWLKLTNIRKQTRWQEDKVNMALWKLHYIFIFLCVMLNSVGYHTALCMSPHLHNLNYVHFWHTKTNPRTHPADTNPLRTLNPNLVPMTEKSTCKNSYWQ